MDTAAKYAVVLMAGAGLLWYYNSTEKKPTDRKPHRVSVVQDVKKEAKKVARKVHHDAEKAAKSASSVSRTDPATIPENTAQIDLKKRKANDQSAAQTKPGGVSDRDDDRAIDQSTRQFAEQMRQVRQGVDVKKTDRGDNRVKTVKPKNGQISSPVLSSGSSQGAEDQWMPVAVSPALETIGIDDMLDKEAPAPIALRITAPTQPTKEKVNKPKKEQVVETKKQRQNRKRREQQQAELAEERRQQKMLEEQQRRTARIARGEPAKNGICIPPAPVNNPWSEQNAQTEAQVSFSSNQSQLLDTFEVESNSSSNAGEVNSTAATSTTDQAPATLTGSDIEFEKAIEESKIEDGWTNVKASKKARKQPGNGDVTPTPAAAAVNSLPKKNVKVLGVVSSGFGALQDHFED